MSEFIEEPGIIIPFELGKHLVNNLEINSFQIQADWKTKLFLAISSFIGGVIRLNVSDLGLIIKMLNNDMGILNFTIFKRSINVW